MPLRSSAIASRRRASIAAGALVVLLPGAVAGAQTARDSVRRRPVADSSGTVTSLGAVTVTATRDERDVFSTPSPVNVIDSASIAARLPNAPVDLFRDLPGLDVTGVGTNQSRPTIRGLRGQRILLLEDGLRLNNARRQQDFGELPALAGLGLGATERVEVVRGPVSVLYGTDAIGGVVNLISPGLPFRGAPGVRGTLGMRYGTVGDQTMPFGSVEGRVGDLAFRASGGYREANAYRAPEGTFGAMRLDEDARVNGTGVRDHSFDVQLGYAFSPRQQIVAKVERYRADDAGFGQLQTAELGRTETVVDLRYPEQRYSRYSLGYRANGIGSLLADRVEVSGFLQDNERTFEQHILVPISPAASVRSDLVNFTDLSTVGFRAEASKLIAGRHILTYGVDAFRDLSEGSDSSSSLVTGFGPPQRSTSTRPQIPNATFRTAGVFAQSELRLADRLSVIVGARGQDVKAETRATPNLDAALFESSDRTAVGAANVLVRATDWLNLVGSVGRGFRSPNLVERFFDGALPEGGAYQRRNLDLDPETSVNVDVGARLRGGPFYAEAFVFRNDVRDGIQAAPTGDSVAVAGSRRPLPAYQNRNIERLRFTGAELAAGASFTNGLGVSANWSTLDSRNISEPDNPVGDSYASKVVGDVQYRAPSGRFLLGYTVRHNGEQRDVVLGDSPLGETIPAFTIHSLRGSVVVLDRGAFRNTLTLTVQNLTNELYAEFANAGFFRPEPRRGVTVAWVTTF